MCRSEWRHSLSPTLGLVCLALACSGGASVEGRSAQATGCAPIDSGHPSADSSSATENVRGGRSFRCTLHAGGPVINAALIPDSAENTIERVELRYSGETTPFQTLDEGEDEPPYRGAEFFVGRDLDDDGYLDLWLLNSWGVTGNKFYNVWRWSPDHRRFVFDTTLSAIASPVPVAGRACVRTHANSGDAGMSYEAATLCLENGQWIRVATESQHRVERLNAFVREQREWRGTSLVLTRVDTVRDSTP